MAQETHKYSRSLSGSIGAGMKSLMGGDGRRYYVLEHKVSSKYHKAGENQRIIVDQIELGRGSNCQVRFDESFTTVSRRHAAIVKDGDNWKLIQLSQTNSTYLNGHKVTKEWYLQNGDEIQLSTNGPRLGFIVPQGTQGLVKSIGLSARLSLFRQQALRPYKQALTALSCVFAVALIVGAFFIYDGIKERNAQQEIINELTAQLVSINDEKQRILDDLADAKATNDALKKRIKDLSKRVDEIPSHTSTSVNATGVSNSAIQKCLPYVFYIQTVGFEITWPDGSTVTRACSDGTVPGWSGTGFLLSDGRFVTARHVVEGWNFWQSGGEINERLAALNVIANNGGKVVAHFAAVSSSGQQLTFTSSQFTCNRSGDYAGTLEDGSRVTLAQLGDTDFAYLKTGGSQGLKFDKTKCNHLEMGTQLTVLGFPLGLGANAIDDINPIYGSGIVASNGLNRGLILTTDTNYEQGNSGGPVFYTDASGDLVVVGIVSAGAGRNTGFVVPISVIH